jgi:membrane protease YdiL (CAAX protease family)
MTLNVRPTILKERPMTLMERPTIYMERPSSEEPIDIVLSLEMLAEAKKPKAAKAKRLKNKSTSTKSKVAITKNAWVGTYVAAALLLPQLALLWQPLTGVYTTVVSLVLLLVLALQSDQARKLAVSAAILPISLLVTLSLSQSSIFTQTCVFYGVILLLGLTYIYTFRYYVPLSIRALIRKLTLMLPLTIVTGEILGAVGYGLQGNSYAFRGIPLPLVAAAVVVFAISEEVIFRGLIQQQATKAVHPVAAAALSAFAFATIYIGHGSLLPAVFALVSGTVLSAIYYFKPNILLTTIANAVMKLTYLGLFAAFVLR